MRNMKKHRLLKAWCHIILVPLILYLLLSWAFSLTLENPDFLIAKMHEHQIAEEITPLLPGILGKNDPAISKMSFDVDWVRASLDSLTREVIDYAAGKRSEISLSIDVAPIYKQLTSEEKNGNTALSNLSELSVKTKDGKASLYMRYKNSLLIEFLDRLNRISRISKLIDVGIVFLVLISIGLSFYRLRSKFFEILGPSLAAQGLSLIIILTGFNWYYQSYHADNITSRITQDWQMALYQFSLDIVTVSLFYLGIFLAIGVIFGLTFTFLSKRAQKSRKRAS